MKEFAQTINSLFFGFVIGFLFCTYIVKDWVAIYEVDGVKSVHEKGHYYILHEVETKEIK